MHKRRAALPEPAAINVGHNLMTTFTNRHAGLVLLALTGALALYVSSSDWAFVEMRDGMLIGGFPLAFLAMCLWFAGFIAFESTARDVQLDDVEELTPLGLGKILAFVIGGLILAFYHERFGFAGLCILFLIMNGLFMGQRRLRTMLAYAVGVCAALYILFNLLDFELTILPPGMGI